MRSALLLVATVLLLAGAAVASQHVIEETPTLEAAGEPGSFAEENLEAEPGTDIAYEWSRNTEGDVMFDVHSHDGGEVVYHVGPEPGPTGSGTVTVPDGGVISFFWENKGNETVTIHYRLEGGAPAAEGNGIPAVGLGLLVAGLTVAGRVARR